MAVSAAGLALSLAACETTADKSARLKSEAGKIALEKSQTIDRVNPDVKVTETHVLNDPAQQRTAAVVTVRNTGAKPEAAIPLLFELKDAGGRKVFANDQAGLGTDLNHVPLLEAGQELTWINDQIVNVKGAKTVDAKVGVPPAGKGTPDVIPKLRLSKVAFDADPIDGITATGKVFNESAVVQQRVVVFAVARRGGKVVAAGRAVVPTVRPGPKGAKFVAYFVGDPRKGELELHAPPTTVTTR